MVDFGLFSCANASTANLSLPVYMAPEIRTNPTPGTRHFDKSGDMYSFAQIAWKVSQIYFSISRSMDNALFRVSLI